MLTYAFFGYEGFVTHHSKNPPLMLGKYPYPALVGLEIKLQDRWVALSTARFVGCVVGWSALCVKQAYEDHTTLSSHSLPKTPPRHAGSNEVVKIPTS